MDKGWVRTMQRSGRNVYRETMVHLTNPDHCEPTVAEPTSTGKFLELSLRYRKDSR